MRRRWIAALVLTTSLVFLIAGTALGYWVIPDNGPTAQCLALRTFILDGRLYDLEDDAYTVVLDEYNQNCR